MRLQEIRENFSLGSTLTFPKLVNQIHQDLRRHNVGWEISRNHGDAFVIFSVMNDGGYRNIFIVSDEGNQFVKATFGYCEPGSGNVEITERMDELPATAATASEISNEAIEQYHNMDIGSDEEY